MTDRAAPLLVAETREFDSVDDILPFTSSSQPLAWLRRGDGFVGIGEVARIEVGGRHPAPAAGSRAAALAARWRELSRAAVVDDPIGVPGTGLIAFGALAFDEQSAAASTLIVPALVIGRRGARTWITRIRHENEPNAELTSAALGPYWAGTVGPGALGPDAYQAAVRHALAAIAAGTVEKVVLARDVVGTVPAGSDLRRLVRALSTGYPDTWTYAVDGMIGASPETLVTVHAGTVTARVLAGTTPRGADADSDAAAALALATSPKDLDEHEYAVQSVVSALRPLSSALAAAEQPFTLRLPNVWHLATDIEAELADGASALDLVATLHPTAAVAGTPTDAAIELIRELEPFDRGRYAGPVGWIDGNGDGEWAIALRCAQFGIAGATDAAGSPHSDAIPFTAHAGAGIVAGSAPESELLETRVKFRPIVDALA